MSRNINKAFHALMATLGALAIGVMLYDIETSSLPCCERVRFLRRQS